MRQFLFCLGTSEQLSLFPWIYGGNGKSMVKGPWWSPDQLTKPLKGPRPKQNWLLEGLEENGVSPISGRYQIDNFLPLSLTPWILIDFNLPESGKPYPPWSWPSQIGYRLNVFGVAWLGNGWNKVPWLNHYKSEMGRVIFCIRPRNFIPQWLNQIDFTFFKQSLWKPPPLCVIKKRPFFQLDKMHLQSSQLSNQSAGRTFIFVWSQVKFMNW